MKNRRYKYGSVIKLSGNRSQPYGARITLGYDSNGYPIYHFLNFYEEELDAHICLREYNNKPYNINIKRSTYNKIKKFSNLPSKILLNPKNSPYSIIDKSNYTFADVYKEYSKLYFPSKDEIKIERETHQKAKGKLSVNTMYVRISAFKQAKSLHSIPYSVLKTLDFQQLVNQSSSPKKAQRLKYLFVELDNYAEQKDIISKGYAKYIKNIDFQLSPNKIRGVFTNEEIKKIWNDFPSSPNFELVRDILLILLYNGMRIEELLFLFTENIFIDENYIIGGLKTNSGRGRIIPIHHLIKPIIQKYYNKNNKFLFMDGNNRLSYNKYRLIFSKYIESLGMKHTTHETRHTVESELDRRNVNEVSKNLIMGHKNKGIGEDVYTHKSIQELLECIELVNYSETKMIYLNTYHNV